MTAKEKFFLDEFLGKLNLKMEFHVSFHNLMFQFKIKDDKKKKVKSLEGTKERKTFLVSFPYALLNFRALALLKTSL